MWSSHMDEYWYHPAQMNLTSETQYAVVVYKNYTFTDNQVLWSATINQPLTEWGKGTVFSKWLYTCHKLLVVTSYLTEFVFIKSKSEHF